VLPVILGLVLAAPPAATAQGIEISGGASMGLIGGGDDAAGRGGGVRLHSGLDLTIRLSRTTDNGGLTFGLQFDLDDPDAAHPPGRSWHDAADD
jgi:hypothetical protein